MFIDWIKILKANRIEFAEHGKSTAKNNVYVRCPLCGASDQGFHLGISIHTDGFRGWGCWRNKSHRGQSPIRLIMLLLGCSMSHAANILDLRDQALPDDNDVSSRVKSMLMPSKTTPNREDKVLFFPSEFKELRGITSQLPFVKYMQTRGYCLEDCSLIGNRYKVQIALTGLFRYRVIFPVFTDQGLTTWTGRSIAPDKEPRYLTLTNDPTKAARSALANIKDCLFNEEKLLKRTEAHTLIVCEGPFDALKIDYYGRKLGIRGTCLFGKTVSDMQIEKLEIIGQNFKKKYVLLDPDAQMDNLAIWSAIKDIGYQVRGFNSPYDDPGDMPRAIAKDYLKQNFL